VEIRAISKTKDKALVNLLQNNYYGWKATIDGQPAKIYTGNMSFISILVPAGATHNIINSGGSPLKLYTLYAPPNHRDGVVHPTRAQAEADTEQFDGKTSE